MYSVQYSGKGVLMKMLLLSYVYLSAILVSSIEVSSSNEISTFDNANQIRSRHKRIIWGEKVEDAHSYRVVEYQASLTSAHYCNERAYSLKKMSKSPFFNHKESQKWQMRLGWVKQSIFAKCPIEYSRAYCGGAAITPYAIQTSCRCVSHVASRKVQTPLVYNGWEDMLLIFVGSVTFQDTTTNIPYISKRFLIHDKCKELSNMSMTHNFGIVGLRYPVFDSGITAPVSTIAELGKQWHHVLEKEDVCMYVGWGSTHYVGYDIYSPPSDFLQQTWRVTRSYLYCYYAHVTLSDFFRRLDSIRSYKEMATWSCSTVFGKRRGSPVWGDAGSPVTCSNGWYFGLSHKSIDSYDLNLTAFPISTDSNIIFSVFENSYEYRVAFIEHIRRIISKQIGPSPEPLRAGRSAPGVLDGDFTYEHLRSTINPNRTHIRPLLILTALFFAVISRFILSI